MKFVLKKVSGCTQDSQTDDPEEQRRASGGTFCLMDLMLGGAACLLLAAGRKCVDLTMALDVCAVCGFVAERFLSGLGGGAPLPIEGHVG